MSDQQTDVTKYDDWLKDGSELAALVMHQWLRPVEEAGLDDEKKAVIFPPTYTLRDTDAATRFNKGESVPGVYKGSKGPYGYNIDCAPDGTSVCQIDSVGSQANRMEPIFKRGKYRELVPQITIKAGEREVHLLDAGHRAGDALARFANTMEGEADADAKPLAERLWDAFAAWQDRGDAEPLARIAPTSVVFGAWDSRATQAKLPRIVRSVMRAYNVKPYTRSAQFNTPLHYVDEGLFDEALDKGEGEKNPLSQEGFRHSPAAGTHGGVEVVGEIRRDASVNLVALRTLGVTPKEKEGSEETNERVLQLRRYILGLALVALTERTDQQFNLREGCLLRITRSSAWKAVLFEGSETDISIEPEGAIAFSKAAATAFGVQRFEKPFLFDNKKAEKWLKLKKEDRDKRRRMGPVVKQDLK